MKLSSSVLMGLWLTLQHKYNSKEKLGLITSIKLIFAFGIKSFKFWDINPEKIIFTIKRTYYIAKLKEVSDEPEVHLHPKWQIAFAELIVLLYKDFGLHPECHGHHFS